MRDGLGGVLPGLERVDVTGAGASICRETLVRRMLTPVEGAASGAPRWAVDPLRSAPADPQQVTAVLNAAAVLTKELRRRSWRAETVLLGHAGDPYGPAEADYRLMPAVIRALVQARTGFAVRTAGAAMEPDLPQLRDAAAAVPVTVTVVLPGLGTEVLAGLPGTEGPPAAARLAAVRAAARAGLRPEVAVTPLVPYLTDDPAGLETLFAALAEAGAAAVGLTTLRCAPGGAFFDWLAAAHPKLLPHLRRLYAGSAHPSPAYRRRLAATVTALRARYDLPRPQLPAGRDRAPGPGYAPDPGHGAAPAATGAAGAAGRDMERERQPALF